MYWGKGGKEGQAGGDVKESKEAGRIVIEPTSLISRNRRDFKQGKAGEQAGAPHLAVDLLDLAAVGRGLGERVKLTAEGGKERERVGDVKRVAKSAAEIGRGAAHLKTAFSSATSS